MSELDRRISLDGLWEFQLDPTGQLTPATLGPMRPLAVPGPWQTEDDLHLVSGIGWYRRSFRVAADWRGSAILLHFGAVDYAAEVWLNGTRVGDHEGGYLPFALEVQDQIRFAQENQLIVRVVDPGMDTAEAFPAYRFAEIPHGKQSWYGPIGGLWQSVFLERRGPSYLRPIQVTPRVGDARVELSCLVAHPRDGQLWLQIHDPRGARVATAEVATSPSQDVYSVSVPVPTPRLWDIDDPALYRVDAFLHDSWGELLDRLAETFGFRTIEARAGKIWLNGRPIYLRGALDQAYYPGTIYTPPSEEFLRDRFLEARQLGLNCLRCHIKIEDPRYYQLADELGLLVWAELPSWGGLRPPELHQRTSRATERARQTLEGMIRRDWNHPSIICWTIVNENWGTDLVENPADRSWLREMYDLVKALDPLRLVVDNSPCRPNFHVKSDLDDYHFYYAIPDHATQWSETVAEFARRPDWSYSPHGDAVRSGQEPLVVSEFGNWGLPNVHDLVAANQGEPWWFDTGAEWGHGVTRGLVHPRGVLERFQALDLAGAFGSYEAFVRASQEQEYQALKYEIEEMRRHASIEGYVITELTDVHWECNGLLDLFNHPKSFADRFGQINRDDVIVATLPSPGRRAFWSDEAIELAITVSHYSRRDLGGARVGWVVAGGPRGEIIDLNLPSGGIVTRKLALELPSSPEPRRVSLALDLRTARGEEVARNELDLYLFPASLRQAPVSRRLLLHGPAERRDELAAGLASQGYQLVADEATADLVVAIGLDPALRQIVEQGARAVCLIDSASQILTDLAPLQIIDRAGTGYSGDWASSFSWLRTDRFACRIPAGPRLDWAFASVIPEQVMIGLDAATIGRDALAGLFVGWIQKPAALALPLRLGQGMLLLTTLRLARPVGEPLGRDPVATVLFQDLVEHACSDRFIPGLSG